MPGDKYLLKIISGPNAGAEIALGDEELLVGVTPECDLILSDSLVSGEHMRVKVEGGEVTVERVGGDVYVGGVEVGEGSTGVGEYEFVSLGSTHFVIGPVGGEWPNLTAADVPELVRREEVVEVEEEEKGDDKENVEGEEDDIEEEEEVGINKGLVVGGLLLFILLLVGGGAALFMLGGEEEQEVVVEEVMTPEVIQDKVKRILDSIGVEDDFTLESDGGRVLVTGWVKDGKYKQEVEDALRFLSGYTRVTIWNQENLLEGVKNLVDELRAPVIVEGIEPGKLKLMGYFGNDMQWEQAKGRIMADIPGIKLLTDEVVTGSTLQPVIDSVIEEHGLRDKVSGEPKAGYILIKGIISDTDEQPLKEMALHLRSKLGLAVPFKNEVLVTQTEKIFYQLDIETVVVGDKHGYIVTKNGDRLFEGGVLKGGYSISEISRAGIILKKGKQTITLNIGGE